MENFSKKILILFIPLALVPIFTDAAATASVVIGGGTATFSLSPASGSYSTGDIFSVNILLNTGGIASQGVDVAYLNYNPALLEAQDDDSSTVGIQITAGSLMPSTLTNIADNTAGKITFSQVTDSGASYTGSGTLATIRFKALSAGTANVNFDFTAGSTIDTNIASAGDDILGSVTNGSYVITTPSSGGTSGGTTSGGTTSGGGGGGGSSYTPPPTTITSVPTATTTQPTSVAPATTPTSLTPYPDNTLLKSIDKPEIYVISGGQLRWIPSIEIFNAYNYNWSNVKTIFQTELNAISKGANLSLPQQLTPGNVAPTIIGAKSSPNLPAGVNEGDLVRGPDGIKVYIVNYYGYRRHIFNPAIFNMYGHFKWDQIKTLDQKTLDSLPASDFYRADGDPRVFSLKEIDESKGLAQKRWFDISGEKFVQLGFKWEQVFIINTKERDYYQEGTPIGETELSGKAPIQVPVSTAAPIATGSLVKAADDPTIYYITNNGLKKPLLNPTVFSSYKDNKWENIKIVTREQLSVHATVQAIKLHGGDEKVYLLDFPNKQKRWIKTTTALTRLGIALDKVVPVNQIEFNAYADGAPIE